MQNIPVADGPDGIVRAVGTTRRSTMTMTAAEMKALFTTAKVVVPAPEARLINAGAKLVYEFVGATMSYVAGGTAYTVGSSTNLSFKLKDKTGADVSSTRATTGFIDQSTSQYTMFRPLTAQLAIDANAINQPLCLALAGANPTLGDGTFVVNVFYRVHRLN